MFADGLFLIGIISPPLQEKSSSSSSDIIVIGKRTSDELAPLSTISGEEIGAFSANSVGDVIAEAKQRIAGGDAPVMVNGHRQGSIADVSALPPEAIERVEILPPAAGTRQGLGSRTPVINVVLKQHFRSLSGTAEGMLATDGGQDRERLELSAAMIERERRSNASLSGIVQSGLRYRDRFSTTALSGTIDTPPPDATLRPASHVVTLLAGKNLQMGKMQLSLSTNGNWTDSTQHLGGVGGVQRSRSAAFGVSATLSKLSGVHFWTVIASASRARSDGETQGMASPITTRSDTTNVNLIGTLSGSLLHLPAGFLQYNGNISFSQSMLSQSTWVAAGPSSTRRLMNGQIGTEIPLLQEKGKQLPGRLTLRLQGQISTATGSRSLLGYENAINWEPTTELTLEWIDAYQSIGGAKLDLVSVLPNILVFDPVTQSNVWVREVQGGNPGLKVGSRRNSSLRASFMKHLHKTNLTLSAFYRHERTNNPVFNPSPSLIIEQAFPDRFLRGASGQLLQLDARPVNAYRQSNDSLNLNFNAAGSIGPHLQKAGPASTVRWTIGVGYSSRLHDRLQLTEASPLLDLRTARIGGMETSNARDTLHVQAGIGTTRFGGQIRVDAGRSSVLLGQSGGADGLYRQPLRIALDTNFNPGRPNDQPQSMQALRLTLSVDNLLNARPRVTFPGRPTPFALLPANLDPVGRTVQLSLRIRLK